MTSSPSITEPVMRAQYRCSCGLSWPAASRKALWRVPNMPTASKSESFSIVAHTNLAAPRIRAISATILGMAFGGYFSGAIFDLTSSYRMAFLNGLLFNVFNFAIVAWLFWRRQRRQPAA
jgi:hypothetical protein